MNMQSPLSNTAILCFNSSPLVRGEHALKGSPMLTSALICKTKRQTTFHDLYIWNDHKKGLFYTKTLIRQNLKILDHLRKRVITYLFETPRIKKLRKLISLKWTACFFLSDITDKTLITLVSKRITTTRIREDLFFHFLKCTS